MELKHVKNIQGETASMFLFSEIGGWGIDGQMFADELRWLGENGVNDVTIHINSGGGSVLDGLSIMRAIQMFKGTTTTQIEGIAASIAGVIALAGDKRTMVDFGRIMVHDPSFSDSGSMDEKQRNALSSIREMLIDIFERNTDIERSEIDNIMKTETWFDAITALSRGMVDEIINTERIAENVFEGVTEIAAMVNRAETIHRQFANSNNNNMKVIKNHLKLDEKSDENAIVNAIETIETRAQNAENKVDELENSITEKETEIGNQKSEIENKTTEIDTLKNTIAENVVDSAIAAGKFAKDKKSELVDQALDMGIENFTKMVDAIKSVPAKITDQLKVDNVDKGIDGKSFRELEKENPKALNALKNDNPEKYAELFKNEYGVEFSA